MFRIEIIGNIGGDAEIKNDNGRMYVQFSVADTRRYKKEDGTDVEKTNWVSCFYRNADSEVVKYLKKGTRVFVRGNGETRLFSSEKDRMMKAGVSINVSEIELVGGGSSDPVPRELALPTGQLIPVSKFYYIDNRELNPKPTVLYDRKGQPYEVAETGFVYPPQQPTDAATDSQQGETQQHQQPVAGSTESKPNDNSHTIADVDEYQDRNADGSKTEIY